MWSHNIKKFHMHYYAQNPAIITFTSMIMRDFSFFKWQTRVIPQQRGKVNERLVNYIEPHILDMIRV